MAENLPVNFAVPGENVLATYNYTDVADGAGYISFYPYVADNAGSDDYYLGTTTAINSKVIYSSLDAGGSILLQDFDSSPFNSPRTVKGNVIANIAVGRNSGNSGYISGIVTLYHVTSTGTATQLGTATDTTATNSSAALPAKDAYMCMVIPVTQQLFKKGEYLRAHLDFSGSAAASSVGNIVAHDPAGRSASLTQLNYTQSKILVPFKIEV